MAQDDVVQIMVGDSLVGLIGMKRILKDIALEYAGKSDEEIKAALFNRISKKNYISENRREEYTKAFLREFKRYLGIPVKDEPNETHEVKVIGRAAPRCCC